MTEDLTYCGFHLSCTFDIDQYNHNRVFRVHAVHENGPPSRVFNILVIYTDDYILYDLSKQDPYPRMKEEALAETQRRIETSDYENGRTYEKMRKSGDR